MYGNIRLRTEGANRQTFLACRASVSTGAGRHADGGSLVGRNNATKRPGTAQISASVGIEDLDQAPQ
jgi:hypothetical protein